MCDDCIGDCNTCYFMADIDDESNDIFWVEDEE